MICFVILHFNLKITTIQRNKFMYFVIKIILNTQMFLKIVFKNIQIEMKKMHRFIRKKKKSRIDRFRNVDYMIFQLLIDRVIIWVMKRINSKWIIVVTIAKRMRKDENAFVKSCKCEIVVRFDFFCKHVHHLFRIAIENVFISFTIIHFRWHLNDFEINFRDWQSRYYDANSYNNFINHNKNRNRFMNNTIEQQTLYDRLSKNDRDVLINQIVNFTKNVINIHDVLTKIKTNIFVKLFKFFLTKKKLWILKKHNKTNRKIVIAIETIEKTIKLRNRVNKILFSSILIITISVFRLTFIIVIFNFSSFIFVVFFICEFFFFYLKLFFICFRFVKFFVVFVVFVFDFDICFFRLN